MSARNPFFHTSSSADLTSPDIISPPRTFPPLPTSPTEYPASAVPTSLHVPTAPQQRHLQSRPMVKKDSNDLSNPYFVNAPNPYHRSNSNGNPNFTPHAHAHAPVPSRSPSPNPFAIPRFTTPTIQTIRFVALCLLWYTCSALSSNTGKVILNNFRFPVTLTIVQFFFVAGLCWVFSRPELGWATRLRSPTQAIVRGTLPMAAFQVGGHIFSSLAISRVPVSTVHTIKALSPLFTVLAYALLFGVSYSLPTYISLFPLTFGVMLATSVDFSLSNIFGLFCAFGSTIVFVSQNIFFKKIMPTNAESSTSSKLDKINLLFYSSGTAFVLMIPLWIYSDAWRVMNHVLPPNAPSILLYLFLNGTVHFAQNLLAFAILSSTSPVTYSIASLVKRIAVICLAIVWFKQTVHYVQAAGICLTGVGLLMYNNAKRDVEKGEKRMRQVEALRDGTLPISLEDQRTLDGSPEIKLVHSSPRPEYSHQFNPVSKSSAIRKFDIPLNNIPYPSPPPSTTSSPPDRLMPLPPSAMQINSGPPMDGAYSRQRRPSVDATAQQQQQTQHVGHAASNRPPPLFELSKGVMAATQ